MSISVYTIVAYLLSLVVVVLAGLLGWQWGNEYQGFVVEEILASREPDLAVPIYAQFDVAQTFYINEAEVTKIVVPMYVAQEGKRLTFSLTKSEKVVTIWKHELVSKNKQNGGVYDVELVLKSPRRMGGEFVLGIEGREITHDDKDLAPRIFIEKDSTKYNKGYFAIAGNQKAGDMSLKVFGRRMNWEQVRLDWYEDRLGTLVYWLGWLLAVVVVAVAPHVVFSFASKRDKYLYK